MIRRHLPEVLAIENASSDYPWVESTFRSKLRIRNIIGMVAEVDDKVVGYMIYELHKNRLHVINFAVDPSLRRRGVGNEMVEKLKSKLSFERRNRITLEIRETNIQGQLFFKAMGFRAVKVLRDFYEDATEDAYLMQYRHRGEECTG